MDQNRKHSRAVISNLSSSSLKMRKTKSSHCKFCPRYKCRSSLEEHFNLSDTCLQLYCRELKVRSLDAVLIKCFTCLGCDQIGKSKLAVHLSKNKRCLRVYQERFGVEDVRLVKFICNQVTHLIFPPAFFACSVSRTMSLPSNLHKIMALLPPKVVRYLLRFITLAGRVKMQDFFWPSSMFPLTTNFLSPWMPHSSSSFLHFRDVAKKIKTLLRQSNTSRQSLSRRLENEKIRDHRKESKTLSEAMNEFRQRTALSNYRICCKCLCSFIESATREVDPKSEEFVAMNLMEKLELRRMNKFFICERCLTRKDQPSSQVSVQENLFKKVSKDGISTLVPHALDAQKTEDPIENENGGVDLISIPTSLSSLNLFKQKNVSQPADITSIIYKCEAAPSSKDLSSLYIDRIMKFKKVKDNCYRVTGTIEDQRQKKLSSIKPIIDTSHIHSCDAWEESKNRGIKSRFNQFGPISISFSCEITPSNIETVATSLIISGTVVTVSFEGDEDYELKTRYYLHEHPASTDCPGGEFISSKQKGIHKTTSP